MLNEIVDSHSKEEVKEEIKIKNRLDDEDISACYDEIEGSLGVEEFIDQAPIKNVQKASLNILVEDKEEYYDDILPSNLQELYNRRRRWTLCQAI